VELNAHNIGKDLMDKEDKYAHYKSHFEEQFDPEKFNETVLVILKRPEDTELLAVYTGYINKKKRKDVMEEYGLNIQEYKKIWKRLLYKLRNELPKEYKNMLSISMVMHLAYNCFRNIPSMFL
jgi:alpha-galactosidase/6-phospho-beta-glucosidase family protein